MKRAISQYSLFALIGVITLCAPSPAPAQNRKPKPVERSMSVEALQPESPLKPTDASGPAAEPVPIALTSPVPAVPSGTNGSEGEAAKSPSVSVTEETPGAELTADAVTSSVATAPFEPEEDEAVPVNCFDRNNPYTCSGGACPEAGTICATFYRPGGPNVCDCVPAACESRDAATVSCQFGECPKGSACTFLSGSDGSPGACACIQDTLCKNAIPDPNRPAYPAHAVCPGGYCEVVDKDGVKQRDQWATCLVNDNGTCECVGGDCPDNRPKEIDFPCLDRKHPWCSDGGCFIGPEYDSRLHLGLKCLPSADGCSCFDPEPGCNQIAPGTEGAVCSAGTCSDPKMKCQTEPTLGLTCQCLPVSGGPVS